jgi:hypothetical protein
MIEEMKLRNFSAATRQPVEINFQNFETILRGANLGFTPVKLKNGKEEWIKASEEDILKAVAKE